MGEVRFDLLGPVEVTVGGEPVEVPGPLRRALLVLLVLNAGQVLSVGQIVEALWAGASPASAVPQVRAAVAALRRALRDAGAPDVVRTRASGYVVDLGADTVDVFRFRSAVAGARADVTAGRDDDARARLTDALALWRGDPLAGAAAAFVRSARAQLVEERLLAVEDLMDVELRLGAGAAVLPPLTELARAHPFRERPHQLLMLALYRSGRTSEALAVFRDLRDRLTTEQGLEPGRELVRLHEACLRADPALDVPAQRDGPQDQDPSAPLALLPIAPSPFVGRKDELRWLDEALRPGPARPAVAMVTGPPGVGKSALAIHWAHRHRGRYPDGQLYLDLHGHDGAGAVSTESALRRLLGLLGVPAGRLPADAAGLELLYRSVLDGRQVLVLLDNVADAGQVAALLPASRGCAVLATGRRRPDALVVGHRVRLLTLDPLPRPESVRLLRDVVATVRPVDEAGTGDDLDALAGLCGDVPLALRVAGAKIATQRLLTVAHLVRRLKEQGPFAGLRVQGHHHGLEVALEYSYGELGPLAATLYPLLALHDGHTFTLEHASVLLNAPVPEVETPVDELVAGHLVQVTGPGRMRLHDLIHADAARRLAALPSSARSAAVARLVALYRWTALDAVGLPPPPEEGCTPAVGFARSASSADLEWIDAERDSFAHVVRLAAEVGPEAVFDLCRAYGRYCERRGGWHDDLALAHLGQELVATVADPALLARAELLPGVAHLRLRQLEAAAAHMRRAADLAEAADATVTAAKAVNNLAVIARWAGQLPEALASYRRALRLHARGGDLRSVGHVLSNIGDTWNALGDPARAVRYHLTALRLRRRYGDDSDVANALANLGQAHLHAGDMSRAEPVLTEALALAEVAGDGPACTQVLQDLGELHAELGDLDRAAQFWERAVGSARELGDHHGEVSALIGLSDVERRAGRWQEARRACGTATELLPSGSDADLQARLLRVTAALESVPAGAQAVASIRTTTPTTRSAGT